MITAVSSASVRTDSNSPGCPPSAAQKVSAPSIADSVAPAVAGRSMYTSHSATSWNAFQARSPSGSSGVPVKANSALAPESRRWYSIFGP